MAILSRRLGGGSSRRDSLGTEGGLSLRSPQPRCASGAHAPVIKPHATIIMCCHVRIRCYLDFHQNSARPHRADLDADVAVQLEGMLAQAGRHSPNEEEDDDDDDDDDDDNDDEDDEDDDNDDDDDVDNLKKKMKPPAPSAVITDASSSRAKHRPPRLGVSRPVAVSRSRLAPRFA